MSDDTPSQGPSQSGGGHWQPPGQPPHGPHDGPGQPPQGPFQGPPPGGPQGPPPGGPGQQGQYWSPPPGQGSSSTDGTAIAVFICSLVSFTFCPLIPAIVALAIAPGAKRRIAQSNGRIGGGGLLQAGVIISWVHVALVALLLVLGIILGIIGALADG